MDIGAFINRWKWVDNADIYACTRVKLRD
jgi:hypothetical protein